MQKLDNGVIVVETGTNTEGVFRYIESSDKIRLSSPTIRDNAFALPSTKYATILVPVPEGHRLAHVTDIKRKDVKVLRYNWADRNWFDCGDMDDNFNCIYAVPIKSEEDTKRDEIKKEIAEAKEKLERAERKLEEL